MTFDRIRDAVCTLFLLAAGALCLSLGDGIGWFWLVGGAVVGRARPRGRVGKMKIRRAARVLLAMNESSGERCLQQTRDSRKGRSSEAVTQDRDGAGSEPASPTNRDPRKRAIEMHQAQCGHRGRQASHARSRQSGPRTAPESLRWPGRDGNEARCGVGPGLSAHDRDGLNTDRAVPTWNTAHTRQ